MEFHFEIDVSHYVKIEFQLEIATLHYAEVLFQIEMGISSGRKWLLEARHGLFSGSLWENCPRKGDSGDGKWLGRLRSVPTDGQKHCLQNSTASLFIIWMILKGHPEFSSGSHRESFL